MTEFLPLGTVVTLHDGTHRVMITGRLQRGENRQIYDYCGVLWPEGHLGSQQYLFDHKDVDVLYHVGLQDIQEFNFRFVLEEKYEELMNHPQTMV